MAFIRFLGRLAVVLAGVALLLAVVAYVLPRHVSVSRSAVIDAPPAVVFPYLNSMQKFSEWSPWQELDPEMEQSFGGPESGVGNRMEWASANRNVGSGSQEITLSEPDNRVETALDFGDMGTAMASFDLVPEGDGTEVTWGLEADMGNNPVGRWMGLMMDRWVGADYEKGLERLTGLVEGEG